MTVAFSAIPSPSPADLAELEQLPPFSPFNSAAYADAQASLGCPPIRLALIEEGRVLTGCLALQHQGPIARGLEIPSLPRLPHPDRFFEGLLDYCHRHRIRDLEIGSFGSEYTDIPRFGIERARRRRWEFVLDLRVADPMAGLGPSHRRSVKKAEQNGVSIRCSRTEGDAALHLMAVRNSLDRRRKRGESLPQTDIAEECLALTRTGAGSVFQAVIGDEVLSSILVLASGPVAYYHSAGMTNDGSRVGASAFLIVNAARTLKREGTATFNLGGADPSNPGLFRFKSGFGAAVIELEEAKFSLPVPLHSVAFAFLGYTLREPRMAARLIRARLRPPVESHPAQP